MADRPIDRRRGRISLGAYLRRRARQGEKTIIGYLPGLYPNPESFSRNLARLVAHGVRAVEIGVSATAPAMEGDAISAALREVASAVPDRLELLRRAVGAAGRAGAFPIVMAFAETLEEVGTERVVAEAAQAGAAAMLIPDLDREGRVLLSAACAAAGIETVAFLGAEDDPRGGNAARVPDAELVQGTEAFAYLQTADMPTGGRFEPGEELARRVSELRALRASGDTLPIALGFGLQTSDDVKAAHELGADIAVVGTAMVKAAAAGEGRFQAYLDALTGAGAWREHEPDREQGPKQEPEQEPEQEAARINPEANDE